MGSGDIRAFQFIDVLNNLAFGAQWTWTVYQNGRIHPDHGTKRKRYFTAYLRIFCRPLQSSHRILGAFAMLYLPGLLCLLRLSHQTLVVEKNRISIKLKIKLK